MKNNSTKYRVDHWKNRELHDPYIYIARAVPRSGIFHASLWGNPFPLQHDGTEQDRKECIACYVEQVLSRPDLLIRLRNGELSEGTLLCWCKKKGVTDPTLCHGDALVILDNLLAGYENVPAINWKIARDLPRLLRAPDHENVLDLEIVGKSLAGFKEGLNA